MPLWALAEIGIVCCRAAPPPILLGVNRSTPEPKLLQTQDERNASQGIAWRERESKDRQGKARQDKARQGKAR